MEATEENLRDALREENRRFSKLHPVLATKGFHMEGVIGYGAYSCVKKAYNKERGRYVAIKIISKRTTNENLVTKFIPRELDIIRGLRHENIIRFYDFIETTMRFYIVMQYAEAGTLLQLLQKQKTLSEYKSWSYFNQLTDALKFVHHRGIAHRDIKCENIVLDRSDCLKLIDFGFACRVWKPDTGNTSGKRNQRDKPALSRTFCGSHAYASPELLRLEPYEPQPCDVWASGVVLYTMLFGKTPFTYTKNLAVLLENISKGLTFPIGSIVSDDLEELFRNVFVPAEERLDIPQLRRCSWMVRMAMENGTTRNNENRVPLNGSK